MTSDVLVGDELVREAREFARVNHAAQTDKADRPYIGHLERVADRVAGYDAEYVATAWLHDVIEDPGVTAEELRGEGFPEAVVAAVVAITKLETDHGDVAIERACANDIALVVKAADVADNSDPDRLALLDSGTRTKLETKYLRYRAVLDANGAPDFTHTRGS